MDDFVQACARGDAALVALLLSMPERRLDIHSANHAVYRQDEAFLVAVKGGHAIVVELLLQADPAWRLWPRDALITHRRAAAAKQLAAAREDELLL